MALAAEKTGKKPVTGDRRRPRPPPCLPPARGLLSWPWPRRPGGGFRRLPPVVQALFELRFEKIGPSMPSDAAGANLLMWANLWRTVPLRLAEHAQQPRQSNGYAGAPSR